MQLQHRFELPASAEQTLDLLRRVDEIASCLPGATATKAGDDRYDLAVRMRFGPLNLSFKGPIEIVSLDPASHSMSVKVRASDAKGQGSASGTTRVSIRETSGVSSVLLDTDLVIGGRIAQMGRGMVADVSNDLLAKFVENLKAKYLEAAPRTPVEAERSSAALSNDAPTWPAVAPRHGDMLQPAAPTAQDEQYVDVSAAVGRAMWSRLARLIFFWRKRR